MMRKTNQFLTIAILLLFMLLKNNALRAQYNEDAPWMSEILLKSKSNTKSHTKFDDLVKAFDTYWEDKDYTAKGSGHKPFKRWQEFHKNAVMADGTLPTPGFLWDIWEQKQFQKKSKSITTNSWVPVGPFDHNPSNSWSPGQGRINVGIIDPNQPEVMYVGAPAGGIWKSVDSGAHWKPLSDDLPQIGVSGIAIDYNNSNIIYISTGDDDANDALGIGVLKSVDGGLTWNKTGLVAMDDYEIGNDIYIDPNNSNKLWVATSRGVYKTEDAGDNWVKTLSGNIKDIKIKPGDTNIIYAVTRNTFYKSVDGGSSFFVVRDGLPANSRRLVIDITPANPDYVYVLSADTDSSFQGLYKSTNAGASFSKTKETQDIHESTQAWYDLALAVSDQDPDLVFVGCLNIWKSENGGDDFKRINSWSSPTQPTYTHADIHFLRYYNGRLLCGSDGGIYESKNDGVSFTDLTKGLQIGQFYKISVAENSSPDHMVGGLQDNGGYALDGSQWNVYHGADGMDCAVQGNDENTYFGFIQYGSSLYKTNDRGKTRVYAAGGPERGNWVTPLVSDRNGNLYAGFSSFYKLEGSSFKNQTTFDFGGDNIELIELDPSDTNIVYIANGQDLYQSKDRGATWNKIYRFNRFITALEVHNDNNQIIYVTTAGSGGKLLRSTDQGANFSDISGNLSREGKFVLKHHKGTETLYLGTYLGVYVKEGDQPWQEYSSGLPNVAVRDLEVNLKDNVLVAATYGRGVWKIPLLTELPEDTIAPTVPTEIIASNITQSSLTLSWNASSDNIAVTGYDIYNGTEFVKFVNSTSAIIKGLSSDTGYEFRIVAKDNRGNQSAFSETISVTTEGMTEITFRFYKPAEWNGTISAYFFSASTNSTLINTPEWPGQKMDNFPGTNWYMHTLVLSEEVNPNDVRIVFNANDMQTDDLTRNASGWYQYGLWSDECPGDCEGLDATVIDIYFQTPTFEWGSASNIYIFDKKGNSTLENTAEWPGQNMEFIEGSPWKKWSFVIPNGVSPEDIGIVFNDGEGRQTVDQTRGTTGWFTRTYPNTDGKFNGFWRDSCPSACNEVATRQQQGPVLVSEPISGKLEKPVIIPNPMHGQSLLKFYAPNQGRLEIWAVNVLGQKKLVYRDIVVSGSQNIPLNAADVEGRGIYFYEIKIEGAKLDVVKAIVK